MSPTRSPNQTSEIEEAVHNASAIPKVGDRLNGGDPPEPSAPFVCWRLAIRTRGWMEWDRILVDT